MRRLLSLLLLGCRALFLQPLKRLLARGTGLARFRAAYSADGVAPVAPEALELSLGASRCTGCGLCEAGCQVTRASPAVRALGLPALFRLGGRHATAFPLGAALGGTCQGCAGCDRWCPAGVPIRRLLDRLGGSPT